MCTSSHVYMYIHCDGLLFFLLLLMCTCFVILECSWHCQYCLINVVCCEVSYGLLLGVCGWYMYMHITWDDDTQHKTVLPPQDVCVVFLALSQEAWPCPLSSQLSCFGIHYHVGASCKLSSLELDLSGQGIPPAEPVGAVRQQTSSVQVKMGKLMSQTTLATYCSTHL